MFLPQGWHMVTVVEELERALQLARSGNLGNTTAISPLCPLGPDWTPVKPPWPCSLFGPPNPIQSNPLRKVFIRVASGVDNIDY